MQSIILTFVKPGSIIYTDCFASYGPACCSLNFIHDNANHKENYVDPISGVHTNTFECLINGLKHFIKPRNRVKKILTVGCFILFKEEITKKKEQ